MRKSAEGGFRRAMNEYGMMFEQGEGVPKDIAQAKAWFRKASASEGDAAYNLGRLQLAETPPDISGAVAHFQRGAMLDSPKAMHNLAVAYVKGAPGLAKSLDKALMWFERAGDEEAMFHMHQIHSKNSSATQEAERWLHRAAEAGHARACRKLAMRASQMTPDNKTPNKEAMRWIRKAAISGDQASQRFLQRHAQEQPGGRSEL